MFQKIQDVALRLTPVFGDDDVDTEEGEEEELEDDADTDDVEDDDDDDVDVDDDDDVFVQLFDANSFDKPSQSQPRAATTIS